MFVWDVTGRDLVNLAAASRIGSRKLERDFYSIVAEFGAGGTKAEVTLFEARSAESAYELMRRIEAEMGRRNLLVISERLQGPAEDADDEPGPSEARGPAGY